MTTRTHRLAVAAAVAALLLLSAACSGTEAPAPGPLSVAPVGPTSTPSAELPAPSPVVGTTLTEPVTLRDPAKKDLAMQLVSSAENSTLDWRDQYGYLEDIGDGRGYTGGLIGFTSGTGDMLTLVRDLTATAPRNPLAPFLPALRAVNGSDSHDGLGEAFEDAWRETATDPRFASTFVAAQDRLRDSVYFEPAVAAALADGLPLLGQFAYYDAMVVHGPGTDGESFGGIRAAATEQARTPAQGGSVARYLEAFWRARIAVMRSEPAHQDISRITDLEQKFAREGNYALATPLTWSVYGDTYSIP
ncbi:chitosanase [Actinomycetospora termitidis]|uniref:Chitosanase n=1 Tax=Actinomycetospora termitidis TaxID=3053470 RepID=A0ABT7MGC8_9PSEU|nr:chitosanase [Actinomycetospora sp. Odt1-22]MDL5159726.1 chitosanase [Actinomycetospora sp. Odt1-22]